MCIKGQIGQICAKIGRNPSEITIVAVAKGRNAQQIQQVLEAGIKDIGENRVQEAADKYNQLHPLYHGREDIKWHMVGHLQTNKVKEAVKIFDLIHSVDSLRLAEEIDKQAAKINKVQDILLEVKTSAEESKYGFSPEEVAKSVKEIARLKNVSMQGLMTIAPLVDNPEKARPYFRMLRDLRDRINGLPTPGSRLPALSMGMTDDFAVAIEEGANIVRLGRAIFEG